MDVHRRRAVGAWLGFRELHRPACIAVLLAQPCRSLAPLRREAASLDVRLLGIGVALLGCGDQARVHDLTRYGNVAGRAHGLIEVVNERLDRPGAGQPFPEQPDRLGVRNPLAKAPVPETA